MDKENVMHTHTMEYYSATRKNTLPFATRYMESEGATLSEISPRKSNTT